MKELNDQCTAIFAAFLDQIGNATSIVLKSPNEPDLSIHRYRDHFPITEGSGNVYLLSLPDPQDAERKAPEMLFIVVDNRQHPTDLENLHIWPQRYVDERAGKYLASVFIRENMLFTPLPMLYEANLQGAQSWLLMLDSKGYLR